MHRRSGSTPTSPTMRHVWRRGWRRVWTSGSRANASSSRRRRREAAGLPSHRSLDSLQSVVGSNATDHKQQSAVGRITSRIACVIADDRLRACGSANLAEQPRSPSASAQPMLPSATGAKLLLTSVAAAPTTIAPSVATAVYVVLLMTVFGLSQLQAGHHSQCHCGRAVLPRRDHAGVLGAFI